MNERRFFGGIGVLILVGLLIAGVGFAFRSGMSQGYAQGVLQGALLSGGDSPSQLAPYLGLQYARPNFGSGGPGVLGCLLPLLLLFLFFGAVKFFFWHGPRRWGPSSAWAGRHPGAGKPEAYAPPPFVAEWHRRMHEEDQEDEEPSPQQGTAKTTDE